MQVEEPMSIYRQFVNILSPTIAFEPQATSRNE
jgi:hypothetical protein